MKNVQGERDKKDKNRDIAGRLVREIVVEMNAHPWDINDGRCDDFAERLHARLLKETTRTSVEIVDLGALSGDDDWGGHAAVRFEGRYYDAEEPYGVRHWWELPLVQRHRRID